MSPIYGCTISQHCTATFDNYTDWVMHEDLTHAPSFNVWYCICKEGYYNLEDFENHFKAKHTDLEFKPRDFLLGPSLGERFYCGFCKKVIISDNPRWIGWTFSRYCHVQSHFEGWDRSIEGTETDVLKTIEEWQFMQIVSH